MRIEETNHISGLGLWGLHPLLLLSWTEAFHSSPCVERPWKVLLYSSLTFTLVTLVESLSSEKGGSRFRRNISQGRPLVGHMTVAWEFDCFNPAPLKLACNLSVLFGWGQLIANCWCVSRWMSLSPAGLETALLGKLCWAFGSWDKCSFLWFGVLTVL